MKKFNSILLLLVMITLMGCPLLDLPPAIAPLVNKKTSNTAYKAKNQQCRLIGYAESTYQYDASGRLISEIGSPSTKLIYDQNGYLKEAEYDYTDFKGKMNFEYDEANLLKSVSRATDGAGFKRINKYENGIYTGQDIVNIGTGKITNSFNATRSGRVISVGSSKFEYDSKGNCIKEISPSSTTVYEYDDKIDPLAKTYGFIKGQESILNPSVYMLIIGSPLSLYKNVNNIVKKTTTDANTQEQVVTTYSYTYNASNMPVTRNGQALAYKYENCN